MKLRVTQLMNNNHRAVANHFIIRDNGTEYLQSYQSIVVKTDDTGVTFGLDWDYSNTTLKHLKSYLNISCSVKEIRQRIKDGFYNYDPDML